MVRNYVYVSYGISCWIQHLERQNPQKAPKGSKRYSVPEIKARQYLQIIFEGKAKWYEIISMFPTALAAESNTLNVRTPKKHQKDPKGIVFHR